MAEPLRYPQRLRELSAAVPVKLVNALDAHDLAGIRACCWTLPACVGRVLPRRGVANVFDVVDRLATGSRFTDCAHQFEPG